MILIFKHLIAIFRSLNAKHVDLNMSVTVTSTVTARMCMYFGRHVLGINFEYQRWDFIVLYLNGKEGEEENFIAWTVCLRSWFIINIFIQLFSFRLFNIVAMSSTISTHLPNYPFVFSRMKKMEWKRNLWTVCVNYAQVSYTMCRNLTPCRTRIYTLSYSAFAWCASSILWVWYVLFQCEIFSDNLILCVYI